MTGDGSDEIFGGYPRYENPLLGNAFRFLSDRQLIPLMDRASNLGKLSLRFTNPGSPGIWANFHWNFKPKDIAKLLSSNASNTSKEITEGLFASISTLDFEDSDTGSRDALKKVMERDSSIWLTNESNRKLDRISMAFSIEARSPFQDERVIRMANSVMQEDSFKSGLDAVLESGLFNTSEINLRRNDQFSGDFSKIRQLWSLVVLGYWFLYSWEK